MIISKRFIEKMQQYYIYSKDTYEDIYEIRQADDCYVVSHNSHDVCGILPTGDFMNALMDTKLKPFFKTNKN